MWKHKVTGVDGNVILFSINIFDYEWIRTGEQVEITDPVYKQKHIFLFTKCISKDANIHLPQVNSVIACGVFTHKAN